MEFWAWFTSEIGVSVREWLIAVGTIGAVAFAVIQIRASRRQAKDANTQAEQAAKREEEAQRREDEFRVQSYAREEAAREAALAREDEHRRAELAREETARQEAIQRQEQAALREQAAQQARAVFVETAWGGMTEMAEHELFLKIVNDSAKQIHDVDAFVELPLHSSYNRMNDGPRARVLTPVGNLVIPPGGEHIEDRVAVMRSRGLPAGAPDPFEMDAPPVEIYFTDNDGFRWHLDSSGTLSAADVPVIRDAPALPVDWRSDPELSSA